MTLHMLALIYKSTLVSSDILLPGGSCGDFLFIYYIFVLLFCLGAGWGGAQAFTGFKERNVLFNVHFIYDYMALDIW